MDIFNVLSLIGGLSLFLFGMNIMGQGLERRAGSSLNAILAKLTDRKIAGLLTGLGITAVIQSSSATTVMTVGFVNSGLMTLKQSINVIMGANIGTTVTAWILSLAGIESSNLFVRLLKPSSFTPILALIGIVFYTFSKREKKKDTGLILLGFATLMFGMESMSAAVSGLKNEERFRQLFLMFTNPIFGVLAGAILTAIIQSSSASIGILQALAATGQISFGAAIPIILGQNIGTCVTAMISSIGANKNAKRTAVVHLAFNVIGTVVWLSVFCIVQWLAVPAFLSASANALGIAIIHSVFNVLCTLLMFPLTNILERIVCDIIPDNSNKETVIELDERLLNTPAVALERCRQVSIDMAGCSFTAMREALQSVDNLKTEISEKVRSLEKQADHYEDILGSYLVKLSIRQISEENSAVAAELLKVIGDLERISDHAVEVVAAAEELQEKNIRFSDEAKAELRPLLAAVGEIMTLTENAFIENEHLELSNAAAIKAMIDQRKEHLRDDHIIRMQHGSCSIEAGFIWADLLTALERVAAHCMNIIGCVSAISKGNLSLHEAEENIGNAVVSLR